MAEKISKQPNIQGVVQVLLAAFSQIYTENQKQMEHLNDFESIQETLEKRKETLIKFGPVKTWPKTAWFLKILASKRSQIFCMWKIERMP